MVKPAGKGWQTLPRPIIDPRFIYYGAPRGHRASLGRLMSSQRNVTNVMAQGSRNNRARARMAHGMRSTRVYRLVAVAMPIVWPLYNVFHKVRLLYKYFERRFPEREAAPENISRTGSSPGNIKCARCRHLGPEADLRTPGVLVVARLLLPDARGYALAARCPLSSASVGP